MMQLLLQGQEKRPAQALEMGLVDEVVATRDDLLPAAKAWIAAQGEDGQPWDAKGYKIPGGTPSQPEAGDEPAGVPRQPAQAAQGRQLPGAAPHHGRGGRGRAGRLRHRDRDRGPLLHRPGHRPGGEEHDPGVLLRPPAGQRPARPRRGRRAFTPTQGGGAGRGHDGRGDRLRLRQGRHRGRPQGRQPGGRRARQGLLARPWSTRPSSAAARPRRSRRRAAGPHHADAPTRPTPRAPSS